MRPKISRAGTRKLKELPMESSDGEHDGQGCDAQMRRLARRLDKQVQQVVQKSTHHERTAAGVHRID